MNKYDEMSDFEINKAVASAKNYSVIIDCGNSASVYCGFKGLESTQDERDYCNNPADMWPIIVENHMSVELPIPSICDTGTVTIYNHYGTDWYINFKQGENPLRAAAIVFLMMKDAD